MPRMTSVLTLAILWVGLSACAKEWTRPGITPQELAADKLTCEQQAMKAYPVVHDAPVTYRPAASSKLDTSCVQQTGFNNCDAAGSMPTPSADAQHDANDYNRAAAVRACLTSKGYTYQKVAR